MKKIGSLLKEARLAKNLTLADISEKTKIKLEFIRAMENEDWDKLPEFAVTLGFIKSIAYFLELDEQKVVAFLRRDYPPKPVFVNPKPQKNKGSFWSPRSTFLIGVGIIIFVILGYLGFQYKKFQSPPSLTVAVPAENQIVKSRKIEIKGKTDGDAVVEVNHQPILVNDDGSFQSELEVSESTKEVEIKATSRNGKETVLKRKIQVQLE